jgi:signal transduction histidine kinase
MSFGTFALFGGLAYLSRTYALTWIVHAPVFWYFAMFISYLMFPAALVAFAEQIIGPGYKNFIRRLWQFHLVLLPILLALDITGIMIIPRLIIPFRILWAMDTMTLLIAGLLAAVRKKYEARIMLVGIGVFSALSLHDMFGAPTGIWLMPAGTFIFIVLMGHILYHRFTENSRRLVVYSQELEEKSLRLQEAKAELEEYSRTLEHKVEERTREVREKQAQLVQSSKMASLGSLVAGVAHEINTPVGAINSMHNTLMRAVEKLKAEMESCLEENREEKARMLSSLQAVDDANKVIASGTDRVIDIVKRLRSFARLDEAELKDADINEGLEDTLTIIHHEIKHNITVHKDYGELPKISCFPGRLNQVFLNIFINAKQAIKGKGEISITTYIKDERVYVEIEDSGEGIPKDKLDRIFDPGYTTKGVGVGTGLGLSICYQIIQDHRGEIKVESEPGSGTKFTVILPMDLETQLEARNSD